MIRNRLLYAFLISWHIYLISTSVVPSQNAITLYKDGDYGIRVLALNNFTDFIKDRISIVQFYLSSCGACQRFAPLFVRANSLYQNTQKFFTPVVVNCNLEENNDICDATSFPTLKCKVPGVTKDLVLGHFNAPNEYFDDLTRCLKQDSTVVQTVLDGTGSSQPLILSASKLDHLFPICLFYFGLVNLKCTQNSSISEGRFSLESRDLVNASEEEIRAYLDTLYEPKKVPLEEITNSQNKIDQSFEPLHDVYAADIVTTLHHLLTNDVPLMKIIEGNAKKALVEFLSLLHDISPLNQYYTTAFGKLANYLQDHEKVTSGQWTAALKAEAYPTLEPGYVGCKGSSPKYRGYPCGLWTLFHSLTVAEHLVAPSVEPRVPHAMNRLISYFFTCSECAMHFATVSSVVLKPGEPVYPEHARQEDLAAIAPAEKENLPPAPKSTAQAILWLNLVHNRVNLRLKGSPTEDPKVPKVIYPQYKDCPSCYSRADESLFPDQKDQLLDHLVRRLRPCHWNFEFTGIDVIDHSSCEVNSKFWWLYWMIPVAVVFTISCAVFLCVFMKCHRKLIGVRHRSTANGRYSPPPHQFEQNSSQRSRRHLEV